MTARRWVSSSLIAALISTLTPVAGWAADIAPGTAGKPAGLETAIRKAAADAATKPSLQLQHQVPAGVVVGSPSSGTRMQASGGGGHMGMILGLVSTVVGVGATVYMVKQMQKTTKTATSGQ
jgi:hypothetical protein